MAKTTTTKPKKAIHKTKNAGCINCESHNCKTCQGSEIHSCGNKKAWKTTFNGIFGKVLLILCDDLNAKGDCPYFKKIKNTTTTNASRETLCMTKTANNKFVKVGKISNTNK